jgi:hypothetical protein
MAWRLAGEADTGGAETQLMLLSRTLAERGFAVCIIAFAVRGIDIPVSDHRVDVVLRTAYLDGGNMVGNCARLPRRSQLSAESIQGSS